MGQIVEQIAEKIVEPIAGGIAEQIAEKIVEQIVGGIAEQVAELERIAIQQAEQVERPSKGLARLQMPYFFDSFTSNYSRNYISIIIFENFHHFCFNFQTI